MIIDKELELQLKREIFKESYYEFFKWSFNILFPNEKYEDAFHVKYLCDLYQGEIERIIRKEEKDKDIIVNIPPRTSKSLITSVCLLSWMWIKDPTLPMINVSFDEELTLLNAQYSKDIIKSDEYQQLFGDLYQIRNDADSKSFFQNDKGGFRMSKTTGGNITGHKGIVIIVDDPQNPKTAESEVHRKSTTDYYTRSLYNRLTPANLGVRIIIMQRLHEEDLTGYLLKNDPTSYTHICLPAESERIVEGKVIKNTVKPASLAQFYKNFLLDPIRLGVKTLFSFRKTLGSRGYSGQYDQTPSPDEGGVFKKDWFDIIEASGIMRDVQNEPIMFIIDSAFTAKTENDPTAIYTCFKRGNILYVLDAIEVWLEFPEFIKFIKAHTAKYQYSSDSRLYIEPKASGKSIAQQLRTETMLNIIEVAPPDVDKVTRAHSVSPQVEARRVKLIKGPYIDNFLLQVAAFPTAAHDDMVDTMVMAINELLISNNPDVLWM